MFIGRNNELKILTSLLEHNKPHFVAVYGRRRIGKTEMIRHFYQTSSLFSIEFTGKKGASKQNQIASFLRVNKATFHTPKLQAKEWAEAFDILKECIEGMSEENKKVIFIDELPWLDSAKSGFLDELSYFWNNFLSKRVDIILIVCGSAASYMLKKVIHNRGPLHGRITQIIALEAFEIREVKAFLEAKGCRYSDKSIAQLYMMIGGVAKYIDAISCELTVTQNIDALIFSQNALLKNEYKELFTSLFNSAKTHYEIMNTLISKWSGFTQKELSEKIKISQTGIKEPLGELVSSGFVTQIQKFGQTKRDIIYRATDPFSYFYNKWLKEPKTMDFNAIATSSNYQIWAGFAFENICHLHVEKIKHALGISGVPTQTHYWSYVPQDSAEQGAQIDLLLEHTNGSKNIDIIECKYYNSEFTINKSYYNELKRKIAVFDEQTKHRYNIRLIFLTTHGAIKNEYYNEIVQKQLTIDALF